MFGYFNERFKYIKTFFKLEDTAEGIDFEAEDIFMDNEGSDVDIRATENAVNLEMHSQRCDDDVDNEEKENISQVTICR